MYQRGTNAVAEKGDGNGKAFINVSRLIHQILAFQRLRTMHYPRIHAFIFSCRPIDDVKTMRNIRHTFHLAAKKSGNSRKETGREREMVAEEARGLGVHRSAFSIFSNSPLSQPTYLPLLLPSPILSVYSHVLTPAAVPLPFLHPRETRSTFLPGWSTSGRSGADARPLCSRCIKRRNDNSSRVALSRF